MPALRQERLRFLDAVQGALGFRLKVALDLPVLGKRTLDQAVKVDIVDGAFDYRALDDGLTWLEGKFLDLGVDDGRFKVGWSVPLFASKEIISWALAPDAQVAVTVLVAGSLVPRQGKLAACRWFFRWELPKIAHWADRVEAMDPTVRAVEPDWL